MGNPYSPTFLLRLFCSWLTLGLLLGVVPSLQAQAPDWQAAIALSQAPTVSGMNASTTDAQGNIYLAGSFEGTIQLGATTLTSVRPTDTYITKWNPATGTFEWALRMGATSITASALVVTNGNLYVAGSFSGTGSFGPTVLTSQGLYDGFVTKLKTNGTFEWTLRVGADNSDANETIYALAVEGTSLYISGNFDGPTLTIGSTQLLSLSKPYRSDAFVAKLIDTGTTASAVWAQGVSGSEGVRISKVAVQGTSVYLAGSYGDDATFGPITLPGMSDGDIFIAKLTDSGSSSRYTWVQRAGGDDRSDAPIALLVQGNSIYVGGYFGSTKVDFGPLTATKSFVSDDADGFVVKLTDAGTSSTFSWLYTLGGRYDEYVSGLAFNGSGLCMTGIFSSSTLVLGSSTLTNTSRNCINCSDLFVAQLEETGSSATCVWARPVGGSTSAYHPYVSVIGQDIYLIGSFSDDASFGSLPALSAPKTISAFIARLGLPATVQIVGDTTICGSGALTLRASATAPALAYRWNTGATTAAIQVTQPGEYTVTTTFVGGASATATHRVRAIAPLVRIVGDTLLCSGTTGQLTASAPGATSVQWSTGSRLPTIDITTPGVYRLTATYSGGCSTTTQVTVSTPALQVTGPLRACVASSPVLLTALAPGATGFHWNTGASSATLPVAQPGTYTVTATFAGGCELVRSHTITTPVATISGDSLLCAGTTLSLSAQDALATGYAWNTGATTPTLTVTQPGAYTVRLTYPGGCISEAQTRVRLLPVNSPFTLGADTTLCAGQQLVLRAPASSAPGTSYRWSDGSTGPSLTVREAGVYEVEMRSACSTQTARRRVQLQNCWFVPNVVTANGDGKNDRFVPQGLVGDWSLSVFNRWGTQVYSAERYDGSWGNAPAGTYYYVLRQTGTQQLIRGWVQVL